MYFSGLVAIYAIEAKGEHTMAQKTSGNCQNLSTGTGKRTPGGAAGEPGHTLCRSPTPNLLQSCKSKFQVLVQVESPPFRLPRRVASRERKYATALTAVYTRRVCSIESAAIAAFEDV